MGRAHRALSNALRLGKHLSCASSVVQRVSLMGSPKYHQYPLFCSSNIFYKCKLFSAKSLTSIQFPRLRNPITALYCNQAGKNLAVHQDETEHLLLNLIKHPRKKSLSGKKKKKAFLFQGGKYPFWQCLITKTLIFSFQLYPPDFPFQDIISINPSECRFWLLVALNKAKLLQYFMQ